MELRTGDNSGIYWRDNLRLWFQSHLPYRVDVVIGYHGQGDSIETVLSIFKRYLERSKAKPNISSGRVAESNGETYYYIECQKPIFPQFLYPVSWQIDKFIMSLSKKFR